MKRILITGANSYIGTSFEKWVNRYPNKYKIDTVDMMGEDWKSKSFVGYDAVFHVAGIAHADIGRISSGAKKMYYSVNCDLAFETAKKAKNEGVKQFIYMSSIIVYGEVSGRKPHIITIDTQPMPTNFYGDSKLQAEKKLLSLENGTFGIVILRPPMIYGKNSKGNYALLSKIACQTPVFPNINNQRSMLYVDNLSEFVRLMIEHNERGVFFPQNAEYVNTTQMVKLIAQVHHRKVLIFRGMGWIIHLLQGSSNKLGNMANKAFGNLVYDKDMSKHRYPYQLVSFKDSITATAIHKED